MLNKQAQEEAYNSYYNQGVELALGQVKVAGKTKEIIRKMIQLPSTTLGGLLGGAASYQTLHNLIGKDSIQKNPALLGLAGYLIAAGAGASAMGSYKGTGKAVDMADVGIQKLLKKLKK